LIAARHHSGRCQALRSRQRKLGVTTDDGSIIAFPRIPRVAAQASARLNRWSDAEGVEHLLGMSLDRMHDYLPGLPMA
jgi:hypothetical protein